MYIIDLLFPSPTWLSVQVSFRYHCQLYSEWRRTNQKVRLLIPEARESNSSQHSLLSTKLMKKSANESIVWDQMGMINNHGVFNVPGLIVDASSPSSSLYRSTCELFFVALFFNQYLIHFTLKKTKNVSSCGCRNECIQMETVRPHAGCWRSLCKGTEELHGTWRCAKTFTWEHIR